MSETTLYSSPESEPSEDLLEFEGTTVFKPFPAIYRYSLTLKGGYLRVWLENCATKEQWSSTKLGVEDYVNFTNAIPNATSVDYFEYFHDLFSTEHDNPITFQQLKEDVFCLEMTVKLQVLNKSRSATYRIEMEPISLERIDVLEAKMRDLQEAVEYLGQNVGSKRSRELEDLHTEVKKMRNDLYNRDEKILGLQKEIDTLRQGQDTTATLQLTATDKVSEWICWDKYANGTIVMNLPGLYHVTVVVNYISTTTNTPIQLIKNGGCIEEVYCSSAGGYSSAALTCITHVKKSDAFAVKCPARLVGTSYLTFIRLGK